MADKKTITIAIMDAPYENARSTTTLRLIDLAAKRGYNINVFAYEAPYCSLSRNCASQRGAWRDVRRRTISSRRTRSY
jgi:hypothetical protein